MNKKKDEKGFTIIEILVAIAIFSIGMLAVASLQITSINANTSARKISDVTILAENQIESLMSLAYNDSELDPTLNPHQILSAPYTTIWNITEIDIDGDATNDSKFIDISVQYNGPSPKTVALQYIIPGP